MFRAAEDGRLHAFDDDFQQVQAGEVERLYRYEVDGFLIRAGGRIEQAVEAKILRQAVVGLAGLDASGCGAEGLLGDVADADFAWA